MNASCILLWLVSLAQITSGTPLPEDAQIFTITLKEGQSERVVYAAVKEVDGDFVSEFDLAKPPARVELHLDSPWAPVPPKMVLSQNIKEILVEPKTRRTQRYKDSGFQELETAKGRIWVASETIARDSQAKILQAARDADLESRAAAQVVETKKGGRAGQGPGFVRLWGRHIMIVVTALVVVVAAIRVCF